MIGWQSLATRGKFPNPILIRWQEGTPGFCCRSNFYYHNRRNRPLASLSQRHFREQMLNQPQFFGFGQICLSAQALHSEAVSTLAAKSGFDTFCGTRRVTSPATRQANMGNGKKAKGWSVDLPKRKQSGKQFGLGQEFLQSSTGKWNFPYQSF